jgi:hypothetical protein
MSKNSISKENIDVINMALEAKGAKAIKKNENLQISERVTLSEGKRFTYKLIGFKGRVIKTQKSFYKRGVQTTIEKGKKWDDIPPDVRSNILFTDNDFETE